MAEFGKKTSLHPATYHPAPTGQKYSKVCLHSTGQQATMYVKWPMLITYTCSTTTGCIVWELQKDLDFFFVILNGLAQLMHNVETISELVHFGRPEGCAYCGGYTVQVHCKDS